MPWRCLTASLAIGLGSYLGYWSALLANNWVVSTFPAEKAGVAWGTGVAAVTAIWKAFAEFTESIRNAWLFSIQENDKFDHIKALFNIATISFGLVLGFNGISKIVGLEESTGQKSAETQTQFVYVVTYQGKVAPSYLFAPTLVFASAGLSNPDLPDQSDHAIEDGHKLFVKNSVVMSAEQQESASRLVNDLVKDCTFQGADQILKLVVEGFANDQPILNAQKQKRKDSDRLNLEVANLRGEALYKALKKAAEKRFPNLWGKELLVERKQWKSYDEMRYDRDNKVFRNMQIAISPKIDHRSAVVIVARPGKCPSLTSPIEAEEIQNLHD